MNYSVQFATLKKAKPWWHRARDYINFRQFRAILSNISGQLENRCAVAEDHSSIAQCTVFGRWDIQTVTSERVTNAGSVTFGLALLSATVSTVQLNLSR